MPSFTVRSASAGDHSDAALDRVCRALPTDEAMTRARMTPVANTAESRLEAVRYGRSLERDHDQLCAGHVEARLGRDGLAGDCGSIRDLA